jgi:hypothetical protein
VVDVVLVVLRRPELAESLLHAGERMAKLMGRSSAERSRWFPDVLWPPNMFGRSQLEPVCPIGFLSSSNPAAPTKPAGNQRVLDRLLE